MPLLNLRLLEYMIQLSPEFDVVIPRIGDETEPLHAIYSKACVRPIGDLLDRGQRRVIRFFHQVRVRYVERDEIEAFDPEHLSFFNINTPADLQRGQQLFRQASRSCSRTSSLRTLVVGYGNLDRGDDGVAYYVVNALRQRLEQGPLKEDQTGLEELDAQIDSIFLTQLVPELINALSNYDQVIFVDAHVLADVPGLHCTQVQPNSASSAFAHHLTPAVLLALLKELYHCQPRGYIVSVRGYDLHFQRGLSAATGALVEPAANCLMRLLCER
jgi:hydrogenase maturation protease